ncbi:MAG: polyphosphate kinase 1 [Bacteroidota bacterium]
MKKAEPHLINREISWLHFNERVLQEAADPTNPVLERIRFLSIFSSNLDEFFRVRVATVKRMFGLKKKAIDSFDASPENVLNEINDLVIQMRNHFEVVFDGVLKELKEKNIFLLNEKELDPEQGEFVQHFFRENVRNNLFPIKLRNLSDPSRIRDKSIYHAVVLSDTKKKKKTNYALIEIPTESVGRFLILPKKGNSHFIILLDDIIRYCLKEIFHTLGYNRFSAYTFKLTKDAELDIDNDISKSFSELMTESLKRRKKGQAVRFIFDETMPKALLEALIEKLKVKSKDGIIPGTRYHNSKDFIRFPNVGSKKLEFPELNILLHPRLEAKNSIFDSIRKNDILLHYPYQSFQYIIDLLREASLDTNVVSVKMILYRLALNSSIVNALVNAARNGKQVTVFIEIQARFDEEANIHYLKILQEEGVRIIQGVPGMKVHAKLCLIKRKEGKKYISYANIATGNFNEKTARQYCDDSLLTSDLRITHEVNEVFEFLEKKFTSKTFSHLLVSPLFMRKQISELIRHEIKQAAKGLKAEICMKMNSLVDPDIAKLLLEAGNAGVKVKLIIRGASVLLGNISGFSENIEVVSIVDRFLEHSRIFIFHNGGKERVYISSADIMTRNLDHRIEVACPIYDKHLIKEIKDILQFQLRDNVKARSQSLVINAFKKTDNIRIRSQEEIYKYLQTKEKRK